MKGKKLKIFAMLAVVLLGAAAIVGYFWWQGETYVKTIDARVDALQASIIPGASGRLVAWTGQEGAAVVQNQTLGTIEGAAVVGVNAPITGSVIQVSVIEGQSVAAGQTIAIVADTANPYISANIEETEIGRVQVGQPVEIVLDAFPGQVFNGLVATVGDAANSVFSLMSSSSSNGNYTKVTQLIPITVEFAETYEETFRLGSNAEIKIHVKEAADPELVAQITAAAAGGKGNGGPEVLTGILTPVYSSNIFAKSPGKVLSVQVERGDFVKAGDLIVKQDSSDVQLAAGQGSTPAEMLGRLKASYELAEETYQKNVILYEAGTISEMVLKQSETQRDNALLQYRGSANSVSEQVGNTQITAPGDGMVVSLNVQEGDYAASGTNIGSIADLSQLILTCNVDENKLKDLAVGNTVEVKVAALELSCPGTVSYISPVAAPGGKVFPVEITVENPDLAISAGMSATVELAAE